MSYQDVRNNVHSLLSILDEPTSSAHAAQLQHQAPPAPAPAGPARADPSPSRSPGRRGPSHSPVSSVIPSQRQLDTLLSTLNARSGSTAAPPAPAAQRSPSAFAGSKRRLIEPFGPVAHAQAQQRVDGFDPNVFGSVVAPHEQRPAAGSASSDSYEARRASQDGQRDDIGQMSFAGALPVVSRLLGDEGFVIELKKLKAQQDALERRMWAKREKIKAEHVKNTQAERDIARIARRPIPPEKHAQMASALAAELDEFYRLTVLPSFDSMAERQRATLEILGVPGLGGDPEEPKIRKRIRGIMDVLQGAMDE